MPDLSLSSVDYFATSISAKQVAFDQALNRGVSPKNRYKKSPNELLGLFLYLCLYGKV